MTTDERLDRLTAVVDSLATSVVHHDNQIDSLLRIVEKHDEEIVQLRRSSANIERLLEAYLKRLPPQ